MNLYTVTAVFEAVDNITSTLGRVENGLKSVGRTMQQVGGVMTAAVTLPLVMVAKTALETATEFESSMNIMEVAARSSGTGIDSLHDAAIKIGADTELVGVSASGAAEAMTNFYKAGLTTEDMFGDLNGYLEEGASLSGALRAAIDLAAASELDMGIASELVAVGMATWGYGAEDAILIANSFVQTADASIASVSDLAASMENIGPVAAGFGFSMGEVNTALGLLSERGIVGAEAGTAVKSMMNNMMRQTPAVTGALDELGISLYDNNGEMYDLTNIMGQFDGALGNSAIAAGELTEEQRNNYIQTIAGTYGMKAMIPLLSEGMEGWNGMSGAIDAAATVQEVAAARTQGMGGAMEQFEGAMETLLITLGEEFLPDLTKLVKVVTDFISSLIEGDPALLRWGVIIAAIVAAIGPLLLILGTVISVIGTVVGVVTAIGAPILLVIAAIIAVVVLLAIAIAANWGIIRDALLAAWEQIKPVFDQFMLGVGQIVAWVVAQWPMIQQIIADVMAKVAEIIVTVITVVVPFIMEMFGQVVAWVQENWPAIQATIVDVMGKVSAVIDAVINEVVPFIMEMFAKVVTWVQENWPLIQETVTTVLTAIQSVITTVLGWIAVFWQAHGEAIVNWVTLAWENLKIIISTGLDFILGIIRTVMLIITGDWAGAWEEIKSIAETILAAAWQIIQNVLNMILGFFDTTLAEVVSTVSTKFWEIVTAVGDWMLKAYDKVVEIINNIKTFISSFNLRDAGMSLIDGFIGGIRAMAQRAADAARAVAQAAVDAVENLLGIHSRSTVFATLGENSMLGYMAGVLGMESMVARAMVGTMSNVSLTGARAAQGAALEQGTVDNSRTTTSTSNVNVYGSGLSDILTLATGQL